jgi:Transposase DDE domain
VKWRVAMRQSECAALDKNDVLGAIFDESEYLKASIRAKVEHPFQVIKQYFGFLKVRYRGLKKNTAQLTTLVVLSNLWIGVSQVAQVLNLKACKSEWRDRLLANALFRASLNDTNFSVLCGFVGSAIIF